jgi:hypothetical protein
MVSFGSPGNEDRYSQMNIELAPAQTPVAAPYLMCYPPEPLPATVGPIQRGIEEPSVGCEIDFKEADGKGMAGLALGRRDKKHFRVMIDQAKTLVVDGSDLGLEIKEMNLPAELRAAMERDNDRVGLTLTIQKRSLAIRVCANRKPVRSDERFRAAIGSGSRAAHERTDGRGRRGHTPLDYSVCSGWAPGIPKSA